MKVDPKRCGARTRAGGSCRKIGPAGGRCKLHAGRPPTHGRYSQHVRVFGDRFIALAQDPELLKCDREITIHDLRIERLAEALRDAEQGGPGWTRDWVLKLRDTGTALRAGIAAKDAAAMKSALDQFEKLLESGAGAEATWDELLKVSRSRSQIAARAGNVQARQQSVMTEGHVMVLLTRMLEVLRDVAGIDVARQAAAAFQREVLGTRPDGAAAPN